MMTRGSIFALTMTLAPILGFAAYLVGDFAAVLILLALVGAMLAYVAAIVWVGFWIDDKW